MSSWRLLVVVAATVGVCTATYDLSSTQCKQILRNQVGAEVTKVEDVKQKENADIDFSPFEASVASSLFWNGKSLKCDFINSYSRDYFILDSNFMMTKRSERGPWKGINANHVQIWQYNKVATTLDSELKYQLPGLLIRGHVCNPGVKQLMDKVKPVDAGPEWSVEAASLSPTFNDFMFNTDNGKNTHWLAKGLGLVPTKITIARAKRDDDRSPQSYVDVEVKLRQDVYGGCDTGNPSDKADPTAYDTAWEEAATARRLERESELLGSSTEAPTTTGSADVDLDELLEQLDEIMAGFDTGAVCKTREVATPREIEEMLADHHVHRKSGKHAHKHSLEALAPTHKGKHTNNNNKGKHHAKAGHHAPKHHH